MVRIAIFVNDKGNAVARILHNCITQSANIDGMTMLFFLLFLPFAVLFFWVAFKMRRRECIPDK